MKISLISSIICSALNQWDWVLGETCSDLKCHISHVDRWEDKESSNLHNAESSAEEGDALFLLQQRSTISSAPLQAPVRDEIYTNISAGKGTGMEGTNTKAKRVAVVTSGTVTRYLMEQAMQGLLEPLVRQGHKVDYFLALNAEEFTPWRSGAEEFVKDPAIPWAQSPHQFISQRVVKAGATAKAILLPTKVEVNEQKEQAFITHGRFNDYLGKGPSVRTSVVKMFKMLNRLKVELEAEEALSGRYDRVIIAKDDGLWLAPFDLNQLESYSNRSASSLGGWSLACDRQWSSFDPRPAGLTEYILVLEREAAEPYLSSYSHILEPTFGYHLLANLEYFFGALGKAYKVEFEMVPPRLMPMQRGGRIVRFNGTVALCLHKYCDSCDRDIGVGRLLPGSHYELCNSTKVDLPTAFFDKGAC